MKIGLVDVDSSKRFPNLVLMKLSAYHKGKGDTVEWANALEHYDIVYMTKVFTNTPDDLTIYNADKVYRGGDGVHARRNIT